MPSVSISVPHWLQERDYSCVPACVRMVLAFYGLQKPEAELRRLCKTKNSGTHAFNVMQNLPSLGYTANGATGTLHDVQQLITQRRPCIAYVWTEWLTYWQPDLAMHTVVIVGIDEHHVSVNDPAFQQAPQTITKPEFLRAWAATNYVLLLIEPAR